MTFSVVHRSVHTDVREMNVSTVISKTASVKWTHYLLNCTLFNDLILYCVAHLPF